MKPKITEKENLIRETEKYLEQLRKDKAELEAAEISDRRKNLRPIAQKAHDLLCGWSHCDSCGWGYEGDNWDASVHQRWLGKIERIIEESGKHNPLTLDNLDKILDIMADGREVHGDFLHILTKIQSSY